MNVRELITQLQEVDPERVVVIASDPEGNSYSELSSYSSRYGFVEDEGAVYIGELGPDELDDGYTDEDVRADAVPAVVFWP